MIVVDGDGDGDNGEEVVAVTDADTVDDAVNRDEGDDVAVPLALAPDDDVSDSEGSTLRLIVDDDDGDSDGVPLRVGDTVAGSDSE